MIVAGANSVKDGGVNAKAQWLTLVLHDRDLAGQYLALALDYEGNLTTVNQLLVFNDVGRFASVHAHELVADHQVRARRR